MADYIGISKPLVVAGETPKPEINYFYGPWRSKEEVLNNIPQLARIKGLTVGIIEGSEIVEYWFKDGENLVLKSTDPKLVYTKNETQQIINDLENTYVQKVEGKSLIEDAKIEKLDALHSQAEAQQIIDDLDNKIAAKVTAEPNQRLIREDEATKISSAVTETTFKEELSKKIDAVPGEGLITDSERTAIANAVDTTTFSTELNAVNINLQEQIDTHESQINIHSSQIQDIVTTYINNKGYFATLTSLQVSHPTPEIGDIAYVADALSSTGYYIYNVVDGVWTSSTVEAPPVAVPIGDYTLNGGSSKTLKEVTDELALKAAHGYASSPKTLKQVDDSLVQLESEVDGTITALKAIPFVFDGEDLLKYPALGLFKSIEISSLNHSLAKPSSISLIQIYKGSGATANNLYIIFNVNELNNGTTYQQSLTFNVDISSNPSEVSASQSFNTISGFRHMSLSIVFNYAGYLDSMAIQNAQMSKNGLIKIRSQYLDYCFNVPSVADVERYYSEFLDNRFSKQDIVKYPALKLFKYLEFSGLQNGVSKNVQDISLTQIYVNTTTNIIYFMFNINGVNNGSTWSQNIVATADVSSNPSEIEIVKEAELDFYRDVEVHLKFDYSGFNSFMTINNSSISEDRRIFISSEYLMGVKLEPYTLPGAVENIAKNRRAILGELPFHKEAYIDNEALSYFYDLEITNVKDLLSSLSITSLQLFGNNLQLIVNENKRIATSVWEQSIVMNVDISTGVDEVVFEGQRQISPLCHFRIKFDFSKWRSDLVFNNQYIENNNAIDILPEYIEEIKKTDIPLNVFQTFKDLSSGLTEVGQTGSLGGLAYERIDTGITESSFRRNFDYKIPKRDKLKMVDFASTGQSIVDITDDGIVRGFNSTNNRIIYFDSFEDLKNGVARKTLYDLPSMNPDFKGSLRYFWQIEDGNILAKELTVGTDIGGLWLIDVSENTATKVFTYRNQWQMTVNHWGLDFNENVIYLAEYGNSPADSGIGSKADATKLWKSEDYGNTWSELYDFKNIPNVVADGLHIHAVHYDKSWDRLWVATGDIYNGTQSSKLLLWSDDGGVNWSKLDLSLYWGSVGNPLNNAQGLSMYSTENFLLIGGDDYQNCIYRVAKNTKSDIPKLEIVYKYNPEYNDRITQYTTRWMRLSNGMIIVSLISGDHAPRRTRIIGTYDGLKWYELWSDVEIEETLPANDGTLTEIDGYLYFQYRGLIPETENISFVYAKFKIGYDFI